MKINELLDLPVAVSLETANRALSISRANGYSMARHGTYPIPLLRIGTRYRVRRADILSALGVDDPATKASA